MNTTDVNAVLDNICDKIGTTTKALVPEMAASMIVKYSFMLLIGVMVLSMAGFCAYKIIRMKKENDRIVKLYLDDDGKIKPSMTYYNTEYTFYHYTADDYEAWQWGLVLFGIVSAVIICISVSGIIEWAISPNAMTATLILKSL